MMARPPPKPDIAAMRAALDLIVVPSRRRRLRADPLPKGIPLLLRIAIDDREAVHTVEKRTEMSSERLREAAVFYIEQILLAPSSDSYRVLGVQPDATTAEMRQNLALLSRWLHSNPDRNAAHSAFILRLTHAWNNVKTPERRAAYDATLDGRTGAFSRLRRGRTDDRGIHRREYRKVNPPGGQLLIEKGGQARITGAPKTENAVPGVGSSLSRLGGARFERRRT
jgi:hypothetical protein